MKMSEFLSEGSERSFMRLASACVIAVALLITLLEVFYTLAINNSYPIHISLIGELLLIGFAGKAIQKRFETQGVKPIRDEIK